MRFAAREYPTAFLPLLTKVLPQQVLVEAQAEVVYRSVAEVDRDLADSGFPIEEIVPLLTKGSPTIKQEPTIKQDGDPDTSADDKADDDA